MDGMVAKIPSATRNMYVDGELQLWAGAVYLHMNGAVGMGIVTILVLKLTVGRS